KQKYLNPCTLPRKKPHNYLIINALLLFHQTLIKAFFLQYPAASRGRVLQPCNVLPHLSARLCSPVIGCCVKREAFAALQCVPSFCGKALQVGAGLPHYCARFW
ncbi:MAG: hypothetical protein ORN54_12445, partial [Cyclobacteriaceae bacterium]|nr:hypothetical protein [Cyclobacteriaceae bacterium]